MTKVLLFSAFIALLFSYVSTASLRELSGFAGPGPTKIANVQDGSLLYLSSNDKAVYLSRITLSSNGKTTTLQQLLASLDANGFQTGWPVNSDLTISTSNSAEVTDDLFGTLFISSPEMAKDPNFLVYVVKDQSMTIDRLDKPETTLLLLNQRVKQEATDPDFKPYYHTTVKNIVQPKTSVLNFYREYPDDGYTDPAYKGTSAKNIFSNPRNLFPTGNPDTSSYFFENIEPVQFTLRTWYIRAVGGIKFDVNQDWQDQSTYQTTNETTTGLFTYTTKINFKHNPNRVVTAGMMVTAELFADLNITTCSDTYCKSEKFMKEQELNAEYYQYNLDVTSMTTVPSAKAVGIFYVQYFRIEGDVLGSTSSSVATLSTTVPTISTSQSVETSTKSSAIQLFSFVFLLQSLLLWV